MQEEGAVGGEGISPPTQLPYPVDCRCPVCDQELSGNALARRHLASHGLNVCTYKCNTCGRTCETIGSVAQHYKTCSKKAPPEQTDKEFKCSSCGKSFDTASGLQLHRKRAHKEEYNEQLPNPTYRGWTPPEIDLMAKIEAFSTDLKNINREIRAQLPHRTIESIKGKRRSQEYKDKVEFYLSGHTDNDTSTINNISLESILECDEEYGDAGFYRYFTDLLGDEDVAVSDLARACLDDNPSAINNSTCLVPKPKIVIKEKTHQNKINIKRDNFARFQNLFYKDKK